MLGYPEDPEPFFFRLAIRMNTWSWRKNRDLSDDHSFASCNYVGSKMGFGARIWTLLEGIGVHGLQNRRIMEDPGPLNCENRTPKTKVIFGDSSPFHTGSIDIYNYI